MAKDDARALRGSQKAAILMLALGEEQCARLFSMMHEDEIKEISSAMAQLGSVRSEVVERLCIEFADNIGSAGNLVGSFENTERLLLKTLPRERVSQIMEEIRGPAGPDDVGQARQRPRGGARQLSQERIPADCRGRPFESSSGPCGAGARDAARQFRDGSRHAHAAHGERAEGRARRRGAHAARRVHVQSRAQHPPRCARDDGGDLQQSRPPGRDAIHRGAGGAQPRGRRTDQVADVHVRRSPAARRRRRCSRSSASVEKDKLPLALKGASEKLRDLFFAISPNARARCCATRSKDSAR